MAATKEEERKALEKIRKIVEELGEDSYLAATFEGCFELAEENIDCDFGISWKQRAECESKNAEKEKENAEYFRGIANSIDKENEILREEDRELRKQILSYDDLGQIEVIVFNNIVRLQNEENEAAEKIVELAEDPDSTDFKTAVRTHRNAKASENSEKELLSRIKDVRLASNLNPDGSVKAHN